MQQKTFIHTPILESPELEVRENELGRQYRLPTGIWVPSVTTVLGHFEKAHIEAWRQKVGREEADKITRSAARRGEELHQLCEDYLNNRAIVIANPIQLQSFRQLKSHLDQIDNIRAQELQLYSIALGLAGRMDVWAEYTAIEAIIDFKTSRTEKDASRIEHYFEQETAYSIMIEERTGHRVEDLVVIVENMHDNVPKIWKSKRTDHEQNLRKKVEIYKKEMQL